MTYFSNTYEQAREKFLHVAAEVDAAIQTTVLEGDLEVDVAQLGQPGKPTLIVTSGLHGVEGFFGSAVQLSLLERLKKSGYLRDNLSLIHI